MKIDFYKDWTLPGKIKATLLFLIFITNIIFPAPPSNFLGFFEAIFALLFGSIVLPIIIKINHFMIGKPIFNEVITTPSWNTNPLSIKQPIVLFDFMSYFFIVVGISLIIGSFIHFQSFHFFGLISLNFGIGIKIGLRLLLYWEAKK